VKRILIVDDSSFMRKRLRNTLEKAGYEVAGQAKDGHEGYTMFMDIKPDAVIMDVTMRGTDGIESASMILDSDPEAVIIFMSLVTDPDIHAKAEDLGKGFVGKNDHAGLLKLLDSNLQK
jgi:two-component system chemotaxis response regulator CheY